VSRPAGGSAKHTHVREPSRTLRLTTAVIAGRGATALSRILGRGGTSLPGLVSLRVEPRAVRLLASQLCEGSIVVAGTNGKTTTSAWLAAALKAGGKTVLHNRTGSNMMRGVATALLAESSPSGRVRHARSLTGLFEVDEAALPAVLGELQPHTVTITNLFRDQLDRYGEIATTAGRWREAVSRLPGSTTLILNADDPLVSSLADAAPGPVTFYGITSWGVESPNGSRPALSADSLFCPRCSVALSFTLISYAHLGHYRCESCGYARPTPQIGASVPVISPRGSSVEMQAFGERVGIQVALPGRYNVYNALAAVATSVVAGTSLTIAARAIGEAHGAFGRAETVMVRGQEVRLFLIKNPTGADEVFRVVAAGDRDATLVLLLSDNAADGEDVSWIWDAALELLLPWGGPVLCGGTRAEDMALRLKYGGQALPAVVVPRDIGAAVQRAIDMTLAKRPVNILATYTAMLAARSELARAGHVEQYWRKKS
jgi:UDP-N-acetylmuramyl tripeptide synthase